MRIRYSYDGQDGTDKSHMIMYLCQKLDRLYRETNARMRLQSSEPRYLKSLYLTLV
jgi:hypothetical protein